MWGFFKHLVIQPWVGGFNFMSYCCIMLHPKNQILSPMVTLCHQYLSNCGSTSIWFAQLARTVGFLLHAKSPKQSRKRRKMKMFTMRQTQHTKKSRQTTPAICCPRLCVAASFPLVFFAHRDALRRLVARGLGWPLDAWCWIGWCHGWVLAKM